jgi:hypothetical protein
LSVNGVYDVTMTLPGYDTREFKGVRVYEDSTYEIRHDFARATAQVQVVTEPPGASAYVDGALVGQTPTVHSFAYGTHRLVLKRDGYEEKQQDVAIPGAGSTIRIALDKLPPGTLIITVNPWADIFINGDLKKEQAIRHEEQLEAGTYTITLRNPHYEERKETVEVTSKGRIALDVDLTTQRNP